MRYVISTFIFLSFICTFLNNANATNRYVSPFKELIERYKAGDRSAGLKAEILATAKAEKSEAIQEFLLKVKSEKGDEMFLEQLTSICLLKMPLATRYSGTGHTLFLSFVKFGESDLMTDFFKSWQGTAKLSGIKKLKEHALSVAENYVQNYVAHYISSYQRPLSFGPEWIKFAFQHPQLSKENEYKNLVHLIALFHDNQINDLMESFNKLYLIPQFFPEDVMGKYFCGSVVKMILIECNKEQCELMIMMLSKKGLPSQYIPSLKLFKGKKQHLDYYQQNN